MAPPQAPVPLYHQCSVIYNKVLYVFSADAFQSLPLTSGAEWKVLQTGVPASDAACVLADGLGDQDSLYVVGGKTSAGTDHTGFQRYIFSSGKWETIKPDSLVMQNRTGHSAVYLPGLKAILSFAGSQSDGAAVSSEYFSLSIEPPYLSPSLSSGGAPALQNPMLLPWDSSQALLAGIGGGNLVTGKLSKSGWSSLDVKRTGAALKPGQYSVALYTGLDQSKTLNIFDLSVTPNVVQSFQAQMPGKHKSKRAASPDGTVVDSSGAPTDTRSGFSQASNADGTVVFVGGSSQSSVALFDMKKNGWVDTEKFFSQQPLTSSSSSSSSSSSTSSSSSSSSTSTVATSSSIAASTSSSATSSLAASSATASPSVSASATPDTNTNGNLSVGQIFGAVFGAIIGFALLAILVLWCFRRNRRRGKENRELQDRRLRHLTYGEKLEERPTSSRGPRVAGGVYPAHHHTFSADSASSSTILTGTGPGGYKKSARFGGFRSASNSPREVSPWQSDTQMQRMRTLARPTSAHASPERAPEDDAAKKSSERHRSSGWGRYFSDATSENPNQSGSTENDRSHSILAGTLGREATRTSSDETRSHYSSIRPISTNLEDIPPLSPSKVTRLQGRPGMARVNSGYGEEGDSSSFGQAITTPMSGVIHHIEEGDEIFDGGDEQHRHSDPFRDNASTEKLGHARGGSGGGSSIWTNDTRHLSQMQPPGMATVDENDRPGTGNSKASWLDLDFEKK